MRRTVPTALLHFGLIVLAAAHMVSIAYAQQSASASADPRNTTEVLRTLDRLIEQNRQLEQQTQKLQEENRQLLEQIRAIRQGLANAPSQNVGSASVSASGNSGSSAPKASGDTQTREPDKTSPQGSVSGAAAPEQEQPKTWGKYTPNLGFKVAETPKGDLSVSVYTYVRYLNQRALKPTFTDSFGNVKNIQQRQDVQITKVQIKFLGWLLSPKFRYFLYGWTNNAAQGLPAQVVLAGNLNYQFSKYFTFSGGITSLPGVRSTEGNFPFWLGVDSRFIADEYFRPSYTSGIWARGDISKHLRYQAMVGNNLSTLGVSAAQLNNKLNTFAGALVWTSTLTDQFGPGFGDFEHHDKPATRLGVHFTRSNETKESQPNSEENENTQLRISDGNIIFTPNLFGKGVVINAARYRMSSFDGAVKYHGMALEGEYYLRWLDNFKGSNVNVVPDLFDHGYQLQASAMVMPKTLQVYVGHSKIFGQFGKPYDVRLGTNWYVFKNRVVRWNNEAMYLYNSPVGYTAVPFALGGKGWVFLSTIEMAF